MNDFLSLAQKRYAVRSYLPKPVEAEKLERILEAGRIAPTAKNNQPHKFLVVQRTEGLEKLSKCTNVQGYPLAIIVCGVPSEAWVRPYDGKGMVDTDTAIVATHMLLEAADLGLGSCWMTRFDPSVVRELSASPKASSLSTSSPSATRRKMRIRPSGIRAASRWRILLLKSLFRENWRGRGPFLEKGASPPPNLPLSPKDFYLGQ